MSRSADIEALARIAVNSGYQLHRELGPGLLESVYEVLLAESLKAEGLQVKRQVVVPIRFRGIVVDKALKADLLVEDNLLIELKSVERNSAVFGKQVLTYLKLLEMLLGLLMNFGLATFKEGVQRIANKYDEPTR